MAADNFKYMARVPIIPDDFKNKLEHKDRELVMDFENSDLYVNKGGEYVNITGQLKEDIKDIQDGSVVLHIVTEDTLPPIKDRKRNNWYYVVTKAKTLDGGDEVTPDDYIYYGIVDNTYGFDKNYVLIAQNMLSNTDRVTMIVRDGTTACFYVPISVSPTFMNVNTGDIISYNVEDRLYAMNTSSGSYVSYDVYMLNITSSGTYNIQVNFNRTNTISIVFDSNEDVAGLVLPNDKEIYEGEVIGTVADPKWTEARYSFLGWSSSKAAYVAVNPKTYIPEGDMVLFAWFQYNNSKSVVEYEAVYRYMDNISTFSLDQPTKELDRIYSVANVDELIKPKKITGYIAPDPIAVKAEGDILDFIYTPEVYNINYVLDGGEWDNIDNVLDVYTINDFYSPPVPHKKGCKFKGWNPEKIEVGTAGDITFTASWEDYAILLNGELLRNKLMSLSKDIDISKDCMSIYLSLDPPKDTSYAVNISSTTTPIYAWYLEESYAILIYTPDDELYANKDMTGSFKDFINLRECSGLTNLVFEEDSNITDMFNGCEKISDTSFMNNWNNISIFDGALDNTLAKDAGRVPSWYKWEIEIISYSSNSGNIIDRENMSVIPGQKYYPKKIDHYISPAFPLEITDRDKIYEFTYNPIEYNITYLLNGGIMAGGKPTYMIDDEDYYPPSPEKEGYTFTGWSPDNVIHSGSYGNITLSATYIQDAIIVEL